MTTIVETHLPLQGRRQGKVRDIYELPDNRLLIVASDRISAFDVVLPTPMPGKGQLLTDISTQWFRHIEARGLCATHLLSLDPTEIPGISAEQAADLEGRIMISRRCRVVPVECVVRGYIEGSGWKEYQRDGSVCGIPMPAGLRRGDALPEPVFTPATKAEIGEHDENIDFERACSIAGTDTMTRLRDLSLKIYNAGSAYARERGIILADTKFEFGFPVDDAGKDTGEAPILIDEVLTPDSSRYWDVNTWTPGQEQQSFDKQFVREYLLKLVAAGQWNKSAPGPELPANVIEGTLERYREVRRRLFG
ncbi:MAG: phosphoribosylaminoimidazolesuccinocarboxamide synthase [Phycisphaerales bacterium]|nr:phosphoribosylaminoimidazolesuccinocarboxamide synthase [Phycisphaerales bacterium]